MSTETRLIIVDDEALVRERLIHLVSQQGEGYTVVGEAENGEKALALCRRLLPDVVITDIVMPRMDGLALTACLKEQLPRIKVILLTNYQDFEYARKALSLGALGYVLKVSLETREMMDLLEKARTDIELDREEQNRRNEERFQLHQSLPHNRKQFVLDVINGVYPLSADVRSKFKYLSMHPPGFAVGCAFVQIDRYHAIAKEFPSRDLSLLKYALLQMTEELANGREQADVFHWNDCTVALIVHWDRSVAEFECENRLKLLFATIQEKVERYLPFSVSVSASARHGLNGPPGPLSGYGESLQQAFRECSDAMACKFYTGFSGVHRYGSTAPFAAWNKDLLERINHEFQSLNPNMAIADLRPSLHRTVIQPLIRERVKPEGIVEWLRGVTGNVTASYPDDGKLLLEKLEEAETIDDVEEYLLRLMKWQSELQIVLGEQQIHAAEVRNSLEYIAQHYHEPLSMLDVCEQVHMSVSHFSRMFKKETGTTFTQYLLQYRINQATRLLTETSMPVQQIARQIGIPDYKYFSRLFRKQTGASASEFRESRNRMR